jgi:hypothetical protein
VFNPLFLGLFLAQTVLVVIFAVAGRTKAEKYRGRVAYIMVAVGCMEVNAIAFSCSFGFPFFPLRDMAKLTTFSCLLLTLPG